MNVLIVDDQASQRTMFRGLLEDISPEIKVADFADPVEALLWSERTLPDLLLLDYRMPKMDGLEFARRFRQPLSHRDVPIVLITVVGDEPVRNAALDAGVIDFLVKPVRPRELRLRLRNLLALRQQHQSLKFRARSLEQQLLASVHELEERERELLVRLSRATEFREGSNDARLERMSRFAGILADAMGLHDEEVRMIELAAPLHDIGMIGVPDAILLKPGPLTDKEFELVKLHTQAGYDILRDSKSRFVQTGALMALRHHERWNGSGYPDGLEGEAIPLAARIAAVADVVSAMTTRRPWRDALPLEQALAHIAAEAGRLYDPRCAAALEQCAAQVAEVHRLFTGPPAEPVQ